jgi:hypothetical protein
LDEHLAENAMTPEQKKNNLRLALVLASVALVFFVGFVGKMVLLGG